MAVTTVAHLQATSESSDAFRRKERFLADFAQGVLTAPGGLSIYPTPLQVSANGTPNMSVNVAAGECLINGTQNLIYQGNYHLTNDATVNLPIAAADPVNPRIDIVVAQIQDASYSGATSAGQLAVITGVPAATPVAPATPANSLVLARVSVPAGATSITSSLITDTRPQFFRPSGLTVISDQVLTAPGWFTFYPIPQTFRHLLLFLHGRSTWVPGGTTYWDDVAIRFNGDVGNNYAWGQIYLISGAGSPASNYTTSAPFIGIGHVANSTAAAGDSGISVVFIPDYTSTAFTTKHAFGLKITNNPGAFLMSVNGGNWYNASGSAINLIQVFAVNAPSSNFTAGTRATLYGLP